MKFFRAWQPVHAICFDLDDTLYANHQIIMDAEYALLSFLHQQFPQTASTDLNFWRACSRAQVAKESNLLNDMSVLRHQSLAAGLAQCGYQGEELERAVTQGFDYFYHVRSDFSVPDSTHHALGELATHCPLVAITNGNVDLDRIGIRHYFSHYFKPSLSQPRKPDSAMFDQASKALKLPARRILHVGDNMKNDVYGALSAGYQTAWYACGRVMNLNREPVLTLPHVQLESLSELLQLVKNNKVS